jgi:hypothetical protein
LNPGVCDGLTDAEASLAHLHIHTNGAAVSAATERERKCSISVQLHRADVPFFGPCCASPLRSPHRHWHLPARVGQRISLAFAHAQVQARYPDEYAAHQREPYRHRYPRAEVCTLTR